MRASEHPTNSFGDVMPLTSQQQQNFLIITNNHHHDHNHCIRSHHLRCLVSSRLSLLSAASLLRAGPASRGAPDNPKNAGLGWQNNDNSLITHHHHHDRNHHIKSHHSQCLVSPCFPTQMTQTNALSLFSDAPAPTL